MGGGRTPGRGVRRLRRGSRAYSPMGRTAVQAAPMVCPEESHQCARRRIALHHWYADSPKGVQGGERKATLLA